MFADPRLKAMVRSEQDAARAHIARLLPGISRSRISTIPSCGGLSRGLPATLPGYSKVPIAEWPVLATITQYDTRPRGGARSAAEWPFTEPSFRARGVRPYRSRSATLLQLVRENFSLSPRRIALG